MHAILGDLDYAEADIVTLGTEVLALTVPTTSTWDLLHSTGGAFVKLVFLLPRRFFSLSV